MYYNDNGTDNVLEIMKQNKTICPDKSMLEMMVNIRSQADRYMYYTRVDDIREGVISTVTDDEHVGGVFVVDFSKPQAFFSVDFSIYDAKMKDKFQNLLDKLNSVLVFGQCHFEGICRICYQIKVDWSEGVDSEYLKRLANVLVEGYDRENNILRQFDDDVRELLRKLYANAS